MANWIKGAIKNPGALRKTHGIKEGETIPVATLNADIKKGGVTGKRAQLAKTMKKFKKGGK